MINMAFVCWNRYLDISEAIEDEDPSALENSDFAQTDVPFDVPLPKENLPVRKRYGIFVRIFHEHTLLG
jgi:intraflagellar transport protein 172